MFFSDNSPDRHRVGWAMSSAPALNGSYRQYSKGAMHLGDSEGGEIDQHIFRDTDGGRPNGARISVTHTYTRIHIHTYIHNHVRAHMHNH